MEIPAIYENGVFRPLEPVALPEKTPATVVTDTPSDEEIGSCSSELYEILSHSYDTGETDLAARVDELDP